jgi:hypothetical protein
MFLGSRERPVGKAENLTAICEPIIQTMWNPQLLKTLLASTTGYWDAFIYYTQMRFVPYKKHLRAFPEFYGNSFNVLYVDDVSTS